MLPASQDVRSDRFATGESSCPDFLQFATNAVSYLAAGTSFFIAIIILSRRIAGGLTSQPSISVLLLVALVGSGLIAAANNAGPKWSPTLRWLVTTTRCGVLLALLTLGIWLPLLTSTTFVTIALAGTLAFLPSHRSCDRELSSMSLTRYWTVVTELQKTFHKNMLNIFRLEQAESNLFTSEKNYALPRWKIFSREKTDIKQLVPLERTFERTGNFPANNKAAVRTQGHIAPLARTVRIARRDRIPARPTHDCFLCWNPLNDRPCWILPCIPVHPHR